LLLTFASSWLRKWRKEKLISFEDNPRIEAAAISIDACLRPTSKELCLKKKVWTKYGFEEN